MFPLSTTVATRFPPFATWALILLNVIAYFWEMSHYAAGGEPALRAFLDEWGLVPARYFVPGWAETHGLDTNPLPFLTNTFLHAGLMHLLLNMWTLFIFGPAVEDRMGSLAYVIFYLFCGIGASLAHAWMNPTSELPAIGASGAIAGITGAYMRLFPRSSVVILLPVFFFPFIFEIPAVVFAAFWFATQLAQGIFSLFASPDAGGVAWWAHIGGFIVGWFAAAIWGREGRRYRPLQADEGIFGCCPDGRRHKGPWD